MLEQRVNIADNVAILQEDIDYSLEKYGCRPGEFIRCAWQLLQEAAPHLQQHI